MKPELILCVPGPWKDRADFLRSIVTVEPKGSYLFAGQLLADVANQDHVELEFCARDEHLEKAFTLAGQGRLAPDVLANIANHASVAYLHFPVDIRLQSARLIRFSLVLRQAGGFAVKLESAGIAHEWERWLSLLSGTLFDLYCSCVVLVGDQRGYYSCGMHHFGHRDTEVPGALGANDAAALLNRFNCWLIEESPRFEAGHTFSVKVDAPRYRILARPDSRHDESTLFRNPHGLWVLEPVAPAGPGSNPAQAQEPKPEGLLARLRGSLGR